MDRDKIYILAEIVDDILIDTHRDPLIQYWDDDCLEIFLDEDFSGGDHQFNHNAFAYHVSLDNQAIDIGTDRQAQNYSHHVRKPLETTGDKIVWELAIDIYTDDYEDGSDRQHPGNTVGRQVDGPHARLLRQRWQRTSGEFHRLRIGSERTKRSRLDRRRPVWCSELLEE